MNTNLTMMRGHEPLRDADWDSVLGAYAEMLLLGTAEDRNALVNAMLAWAEAQSSETFGRLRHVVFEGELRTQGKDYAATFSHLGPEHNADLAAAKLRYLIVRLGQGRYGDSVTVDTYEEFFGPDIPNMIATLYDKAVKGPLEPRD